MGNVLRRISTFFTTLGGARRHVTEQDNRNGDFERNETKTQPAQTEIKNTHVNAQKKQRVDRDLVFVKDKNEELVYRPPGSMDGHDLSLFQLSKCCVIVLDHLSQSFVDKCNDCTIIMAAIKGPIFVRNCSNLKIIVACGQFRTRDCQDVHTYIHCTSQPIIEASNGMKFSCYTLNYKDLSSHLLSSSISPLSNNCQDIYDFSSEPNEKHWSLEVSEPCLADFKPNDAQSATLNESITLEPFSIDWKSALCPVILPSKAIKSPPTLRGVVVAVRQILAGDDDELNIFVSVINGQTTPLHFSDVRTIELLDSQLQTLTSGEFVDALQTQQTGKSSKKSSGDSNRQFFTTVFVISANSGQTGDGDLRKIFESSCPTAVAHRPKICDIVDSNAAAERVVKNFASFVSVGLKSC